MTKTKKSPISEKVKVVGVLFAKITINETKN